MSKEKEYSIEEVIAQVCTAAKYADISEDLVRSIALKEMIRKQPIKDTVKAVRNKLHQIGSAFQETTIPYEILFRELQQLPGSLADAETQAGLKRFMQYHTSTRERLPIVDHFFQQTLASIAPITSVLDIASGLNPLAIPWMPLAENVQYTACDIYGQMSSFLNTYFSRYGVNGKSLTCDVTQQMPEVTAQVAFVLKTIPCLEQLDKQAGARLLDSLPAEYLLVSFPAHSLGGRSKGMVQNYEAHFRDLLSGKRWPITRFEFPGELAFLVHKI